MADTYEDEVAFEAVGLRLEYRRTPDGTRLIIHRNDAFDDGKEKRDPVNEPVTEPVNDRDAWMANNLSDRQARIVNLMVERPRITYRQLADSLGVSLSTVKRDTEALRRASIVEREGSDKTGSWRVPARSTGA